MSKAVAVSFVDPETNRPTRVVEAMPDGSLTLLQVAQAAGLDIAATCGGRGRCRSCRVKVLQGDVPPPTMQDRVQLGTEEIQERFRLSCQTCLIGACSLLPSPPLAEGGHQILAAPNSRVDRGTLALDSGVEKRVIVAAPPTEENHQTSDLEEIIARLPAGVAIELTPTHVLRRLPETLRARGGQVTVTTFRERILDIEAGDTTAHKLGVAFDIGTTTIAASLLDLDSGEELASVANVNPQAVFGGDLMSRIAYVMNEPKKLATLRAKALNAVNDFIVEACEKAGVSVQHVYKVVVVGNTCMHHVFLGVDVTYVGLAPYAPVLRHAVVLPATELPLKAVPQAVVCLLPLVAGFVGADTVACVLATRIYESEELRVLVDIGTNGEVVMGNRDRLLACSAPAGPALEGAQIRHGMRGALGAIEKVRIGKDVECDVIGNVPAIGICGSGLIDAVARMLDAKVLAPSGVMRHDFKDSLDESLRVRMTKTAEGKEQFVLVSKEDSGKGEEVCLTQTDIRQLQLAKGAIYSGILMLQQVMGVTDDRLAELMLCGGFGNYISIASAVRIRLLPPLPLERITYFGNAAHVGAQMALLSETERMRANHLARRIEHVALASQPDYQDVFVDAISFSAPARARRQSASGITAD
jgi:uncharacterized 2Fe-2S/4Fe-4S cluster protein (DUF4445 family)